jgi:hypothetical protein
VCQRLRGTLVTPKNLQFPAIPEMQAPVFADRVDVLTDWVHPERPPPALYPLVSQVDGDGNETAGIRLPAIAVPLATHRDGISESPVSRGRALRS